ncbi:MAG TPA: LptF/LptG family permease [Myxococcota bacterium]|nr:LptF/LptG family permease [Myxococcota bacterium]
MRILSRYLLARYLGLFSVILIILVLAVLVGDMLLDIGDLLDQRARVGLIGAIASFGLRTPARYLPILVPIASFVAAFLCMGLAARSFEVTAMKAGGISPLRAVAPLLGAALCLSGASLLLNETALVAAARAFDRLDRGSEQEISLRRGSYWVRAGQRIFSIEESDPSKKLLHGVSVYELDDKGRLTRSLRASGARVVERESTWLLQDVVVRNFNLSDPQATPSFEHLSELRIAGTSKSPQVLFDARASTLSLRDLADTSGGRLADNGQARRFRAILHERLSEPTLVFVLTLLAVPLALRVEQTKTLAAPALQGAVLLVALFFSRSLGSTLAAEGVTPPAVTPWAIIGTFLAAGALRLRTVAR